MACCVPMLARCASKRCHGTLQNCEIDALELGCDENIQRRMQRFTGADHDSLPATRAGQHDAVAIDSGIATDDRGKGANGAVGRVKRLRFIAIGIADRPRPLGLTSTGDLRLSRTGRCCMPRAAHNDGCRVATHARASRSDSIQARAARSSASSLDMRGVASGRGSSLLTISIIRFLPVVALARMEPRRRPAAAARHNQFPMSRQTTTQRGQSPGRTCHLAPTA